MNMKAHYNSMENHAINNPNNNTGRPSTCVHLEENLGVRIGVTMLYCIIFLTSILGNTLILVTVFRCQRMRSAAYIFIANMAASDILQPLFGVPRVIVEVLYGRETWLVGGHLGVVLCKLAYFAQDVSLSVSVLSLAAITVERFHAVVFPLKVSFFKSRIRIIISLIWLISASLHAVYFHVFRLGIDQRDNKLKCYQSWQTTTTAMVYYLVSFTGVFTLALLTTVILYTLILVKLKQRRATGMQDWTVRRIRENQKARERKVLKVAVAITIVFFASFFPQVVLVTAAPLKALPICTIEALRFVTKIMEQSYAAINPVLCIVFSSDFREGFIAVLSSAPYCGTYFKKKDDEITRERVQREVERGEIAMTALTTQASIKRGLILPCMITSPALMSAVGIVMNK